MLRPTNPPTTSTNRPIVIPLAKNRRVFPAAGHLADSCEVSLSAPLRARFASPLRRSLPVISTAVRSWALLLLALGMWAAICGNIAPAVEPAAAEVELLNDVGDGQLQRFEFVDAALIAGGMTDLRSRAEMLRRRGEKYAAIDFTAIRKLPLAERATTVLSALHQHLLTGTFRPTATLVQETLTTGDFNCVTATVLFHDMCSRANVSVEIIAQSGHVCSRLPNTSGLIETTRSNVVEAEAATRQSRVIMPGELLGRIYYNRALAALEKRDFDSAQHLLQHSLICDPQDRDAQENLLAGLNNWALALCEQGDYAAAARRVAAGLALKADYQPLLSNDLHVHQQWVAELCRAGEFPQALQVLEAGRARRPTAALFAGGQRAVYEAWLRHCTEQGDTAAAAQVLRRAQEQLGPRVKLRLEARPMRHGTHLAPPR